MDPQVLGYHPLRLLIYATGCVVMSDQIEAANRHAIHGAKTLYGNFGRTGTEFGGKWHRIK